MDEEVKLPHPLDKGGTHWEGCYRTAHHHNCAVLKVDELTARAEQLEKEAINDALQIGLLEDDVKAEKAAREKAEQEVVRLKEALLFTHSAAVGITPDWVRYEIMQKMRAALEG